MSFEYIQRCYGVPAERGRRITHDGKSGTIIGAVGHYVKVVMDGDSHDGLYHPTSEMVYGGIGPIPAAGKQWRCLPPWRDDWETDAWFTVTAATRSKARYRAYLDLSDCATLTPEHMLCIKVRAA